MHYVDGFVAAVSNANRTAYTEHCRLMGQVFKDHGALSVVDAWGDDVPEGKLTSFTMAVQRQADESVAFGWVVWATRAARDQGWAAAMADERMKNAAMPFDGKRMIYGGFEMIASV